MPFSTHIQTLRQYHAVLGEIPRPEPVQALVRDCVSHVLAHARSFDTYVSGDSPFLKEFLDAASCGDTSGDQCFSVLECLVIFFREKSLRSPDTSKHPLESSLLHHFESSGKWDANDGTLVTSWYWSKLPQRHGQVHCA